MSQVDDDIRSFILREFLPGEKPENLADDTPLVTSGILDSLATVMLVGFLEDHFRIAVEAHEASVDNLDTIRAIRALVERKKQAPAS